MQSKCEALSSRFTTTTADGQAYPNSEAAAGRSWNGTLSFEYEAHGRHVFVLNVGSLDSATCKGLRPFPPPKLHYSTFWRSLTRRAYCKNLEESKHFARDTRNGGVHNAIQKKN